MEVNLLKYTAALIIFMIALAGGFPPIFVKTSDRTEKFFAFGDAFARGVFLGAGLIHLLPDAQENFVSVFHHIDYPFIYM